MQIAQQYKKRDKIVHKMKRDGLVEQNAATGEEKRVSRREHDINLKESTTNEPILEHGTEKSKKTHRSVPSENGIHSENENTAPSDDSKINTGDEISPSDNHSTNTPKRKKRKQQSIHNQESKSPTSDISETGSDAPVSSRLQEDRGRLKFGEETPADTDIKKRPVQKRTKYTQKFSDDAVKSENVSDNPTTPKSSRLQFSSDEMPPADRKLSKLKGKVQKADVKLEKARGKLPSKRKVRIERTFDEDNSKAKHKLHFEKEAMPQGAEKKSLTKKTGDVAAGAVKNKAHQKIHQVEKDNVGVEAAHRTELLTERTAHSAYRFHKTRPYRRVKKLETKSLKAKTKLAYQSALRDNPKLHSNVVSRFIQKQKLKRQYAKAAREAKRTGENIKKTATATAKAVKATTGFIRRHPVLAFGVLAIFLIVVIFSSIFSSFSSMGSGGFTSIIMSSYTAEDSDILAVDAAYTQMEADLQSRIANIESEYSGYDEYNYSLTQVGHDPFALASYLTCLYYDYTLEEVQAELQAIFNQQYGLTLTETTETRTVTKTIEVGDAIGQVRTTAYCSCAICCGPYANGITASGTTAAANRTIAVDAYNPIVPMGTKVVINGVTYTVEDTGNLNANNADIDIYFNTHAEALAWGRQSHTAYLAEGNSNTVEVTVTETVSILNVNLENNSIYSIANANLDSDQLELFNLYMETLGNKEYLFEDNVYVNRGDATGGYTIPGEALSDPQFAALIAEAEKYLGYPYVWGGSSPSTSFDCSGFVCWVLNQSGAASVGRTTANGLLDKCAVVSVSEAKPGDLIFFQGTYNTSGASHVGIYVGDGMMIHCGNPIQYASINSSYWQSHFLCFGRY
ncbi:MAG: CD1108 family mobile element protein [Lachnospiraceae bacterium]